VNKIFPVPAMSENFCDELYAAVTRTFEVGGDKVEEEWSIMCGRVM